MKKILFIATALLSISAFAQKGGLDEATLSEIRKGYEGTATDKALRNAMNAAPLAVLAHNFERAAMIDTHFSDEIKTKGRTDRKRYRNGAPNRKTIRKRILTVACYSVINGKIFIKYLIRGFCLYFFEKT